MGEENNPLNTQIAGSHYKSDYQPVELFAKLNLNAFQANIVKYVTRYKRKNGIEDLRKAIHYCELAVELKPTNNSIIFTGKGQEIRRFADANELDDAQTEIVGDVTLSNDYEKAAERIHQVISEYKKATE